MKLLLKGILAIGVMLASACGEEPPPQDITPEVTQVQSGQVEFDDPHLKAGREIWMGVCKGCHEAGVAGAPVAGNKTAWAPRIAQGKAVLYEHALNGFMGEGYTHMPPRGGNPALSDEEVKSAVDYMVALAGI